MKELFKSDIIKAVVFAGLLGMCNTVGMLLAAQKVEVFYLKIVTAISTVFSIGLVFFLIKAIRAGEFRQ